MPCSGGGFIVCAAISVYCLWTPVISASAENNKDRLLHENTNIIFVVLCFAFLRMPKWNNKVSEKLVDRNETFQHPVGVGEKISVNRTGNQLSRN